MKKCNCCDIEKSLSEYHRDKTRKDGYRNKCKICQKEYLKEYYIKNIDKLKQKNKEWRQNNHDKIIVKNKEWRNKNPEKYKQIQKNYVKNNKEKVQKYRNKYNRKRKKEDPVYYLRCALSRTISDTLRELKFTKKSKTCDVLGCTFEELKLHLESQFEDWMNWDNRGNPKDGIIELNKTWDIDHIIPTCTAKSEDDIIRLNHYTNLQPLCSFINRKVKRDSV